MEVHPKHIKQGVIQNANELIAFFMSVCLTVLEVHKKNHLTLVINREYIA